MTRSSSSVVLSLLTYASVVAAACATRYDFWVNATAHSRAPPPLNASHAQRMTHELSTLAAAAVIPVDPQLLFWRSMPASNAITCTFGLLSLEAALQLAGVLRSAGWNQNATHSTIVASSVRTGLAPPVATAPAPGDCVALPWVDWCPEPLLLLAVGVPAGLLLGIAVGWSCYRRCDAWRMWRTRVIPIRDRFEGNSRVAELTDEFPHLFDGSNHPVQLKVAWK